MISATPGQCWDAYVIKVLSRNLSQSIVQQLCTEVLQLYTEVVQLYTEVLQLILNLR